MSVSQTHFKNAHHFKIRGGQFTNKTIINNNHDAVSTTLWSHVAAGAIFDSAARYAAGKCHPGTRTKMIGHITDWTTDVDTTARFLWLYGAAGAGKSALAHTICEELQRSYPGLYGGSFFFSSGDTDRGNAQKLVATLSYQLAVNFPPMRKEINEALAHDPSLPTKSMEIQLFSLIVQPLLRCQDSLSHIPVLIVDGLDECAETEGSTQSDVIALMAKSIFNYDLRLRFLIASRPEWWIREAFQTPSMTNITLSLSLRDDEDADKDIEMYLTDGFEKIRLENKRMMGSVSLPWPSPKIIRHFVEEASGQYIYASTVLKFVGKSSRFHNPQKQLEIITTSGPHRASAFSELDALYARILRAYPDWPTMQRVLAANLLRSDIPIIALETVLHMDHNEFLLVLDALSALIDLKATTTKEDLKARLLEEIIGNLHDGCEIISLCHRSFGEFLQDPSRSGSFHIDLYSDPIPNEILNECFTMIHRNMDQKYRVDPSVFLGTNLATYTCIKAMLFSSAVHCNFEILVKLLIEMTVTLQHFEPSGVAHMNSLFYFIHDADDLGIILDSAFFDGVLIERKAMEKPELLDELQAAGLKFEEAIKLARQRALCALPLCTDFEATPALVYLLEYYQGYEFPLQRLSTLVGLSNVKATMRRYCRAVGLRYSINLQSWYPVPSSLPRLCDNGDEPKWRIEGVWRDLRITLAHESLKFLLDDCQRDDESDHHHDLPPDYVEGLPEFLKTEKISDIQTFEYFQNLTDLAILSAISDLAMWSHEHLLRDAGPEETINRPDSLISRSIFFWIHRQLTNSQTLTLLQGHDETLQETLTTFRNELFEYTFLRPLLENCNKTGLFAYRYSSKEKEDMSIKIGVQPLPRGLYEVMDQSELYALNAHDALQPHRWHRFHNEIFGNPATDGGVSTKFIIDPCRWHPYLACLLLKALVSFLYGEIYPDFSRKGWDEHARSYLYLIPCMPYAHPTLDNLDALRAIVYLYPQVNPPWTPPAGLWLLVSEFLQKYDRSVLSTEELDLFVIWLNSTDHADIKTYVR